MVRKFLFSLVLLSIGLPAAKASIFADSTVDYAQGTIDPSYSTYNNPSTALGKPNDDVNAGAFGYGALTPFNGVWQDTQMVGIGAGGHLTLHLGRAATQIGVHAGVGMIDVDYPNGKNLTPATGYVLPRSASVSVSDDNITYVPVGLIDFDKPSNFYDQGVTIASNQSTPGTHEADFSEPFKAPLSAFDGQDWTGTLNVLNGSAGGTWFNVPNLLPNGANFIRFDVGAGETMFVDAVATQGIPEPTSLALILPMLAMLRRRRRAC